MKNQNQSQTEDTGTMSTRNEVRLVDIDSLDLVKRVVRCMAVSPSGMQMAKGAVSVLDSLGLWNSGEIESEQTIKADVELIEWFTQYLFSFVKKRGVDISIGTAIRHDSAYADIGDYDFDLSPYGESWSYRPMRKESGETRMDEWQNDINPDGIKNFKEPPTENRPVPADQSITER